MLLYSSTDNTQLTATADRDIVEIVLPLGLSLRAFDPDPEPRNGDARKKIPFIGMELRSSLDERPGSFPVMSP